MIVRLAAAVTFCSFLAVMGVQDAQAQNRGKMVWDGSKWVYRTVRDGVAYDAMKRGANNTRNFYNDRIRDSNRVEYKAPQGKQCGYVTTYSWNGKIEYKKICN